MAKLRDPWSEIPVENSDPPPVGAPEGHVPSGVNDIARNTMAAVKELGNEFDALIDRDSQEPDYELPTPLGPMAYQDPAAVAITGGSVEATHLGDGAGLVNVDALALGGVDAAAYARVDQAEVFSSDVLVEGILSVGKDEGGDSVSQFYDDTNDVGRKFQWTDTESEFQVEDDEGNLQTVVHEGNFADFEAGDGGDADSLGGVPAADYMRKDIPQTMQALLTLAAGFSSAGPNDLQGETTIANLLNSGDITWDVSGTGGFLKIGGFMMAWGRSNAGTNNITIQYGVTFSSAPAALMAIPFENTSASRTCHVRTIGTTSALLQNDRQEADIIWLAVGAA